MENNELNQVQNSEELVITPDADENLFEDWEETESTPAEESKQDENTTEETFVETDETPTESETETIVESENPFLKIKFNGEEKSLNEEEARILAQKGMNYDRFYEPIERLARMNGLSVGDYLNRLNDTQLNYEISKEMDVLRNDPKYKGVSDEVLEEIANSRVTDNMNIQDRNFQEQQKGIADAQQANIQREVDLFMQEYPEFKNKGPEALDKKVFDYVKQGYTLLEAYNKWSREQNNTPEKQAKEKSAKLNEENKKKSLGNTTNAGSVEADDFMNGFLSE